MMNLTFVELLRTLAAIFCFLVLLVPPGFLLGHLLNIAQFRTRPIQEKLLWTLAMALPLDLALANIVGRFVPSSITSGLFLFLDVAVFILLARGHAGFRNLFNTRNSRRIAWAFVGGTCYLIFASLPIEWHGELFEPVFSSDWQIRLPLIRAAAVDGVPPHNPFFTLHGISPVSRYYYYWFTLCAQVVRLFHADARATLVASAVFAGLGLFSVLFLCLRYLLPFESSYGRRCLLLLSLCCVLGIDVLPSLAGMFFWRTRLHPEIEWWLPDRSPGPLGAMLFAPHHIAGAACGFLVILLLSLLEEIKLESSAHSRFEVLRTGCVVGLIFAAMLGTSTYITMFFALGAFLIGVTSLAQRRTAVVQALLLAAVFSILVSTPYLHELTAKTMLAPSGNEPAHTHMLGFEVRQIKYSRTLMDLLKHRYHATWPNRPVRFLIRIGIIFGLFLSEFGFYLVILCVQVKRELRSKEPLSVGQRNLWLTTAAVGVFFMFITSSPIQFVNDLGVHAGLILRLILMLWGAQVLAWYFARRSSRAWTGAARLTIRLATVLLVLGVVTAVWQAAMDRGYLALLSAHLIPQTPPFSGAHHLARLYDDVYRAEQVVDKQLPKTAVVQGNTVGVDQGIVRLYQRRRQAAGDQSCEGAFGGDPAMCRALLPPLLRLFGTHASWYLKFPRYPIRPEDMSLAYLSEICSSEGIAAFLATNADPVWQAKDSWVWHGDVLVANPHVRVIRCPTK